MRACLFIIAVLSIVMLAAESETQPAKPKVIEANSDGSILLHSRDVTIHGSTVRYEPQTNKNTIGYWIKVEDWVSWDFKVSKPGTYAVKILQGCGPDSGGSEVDFISAGQTN